MTSNRENNNYYIWFRYIVNTCIALFFLFSLVSNLFVYVSVFNGWTKYLLLIVIAAVFAFIVVKFKELLRKWLNQAITYLQRYSFWQLIGCVIAISIILKAFYYAFFFFDSTKFGQDITVYANLADKIAEGGIASVDRQIYYLVGMGIHLSIFKKLSIPYDLGVYVVFLIGTIINFFSFTKYIGKEKTFLLIVLYLLMPSTSMLTFCVTHELFVYLYFSIIFVVLNALMNKDETKDLVLYSFLAIIFISLNQTISPMGKIWFILLALLMLLTRIGIKKRIAILAILLISYFCSNYLTTSLEGNNASKNNNYEQLLIGCDLESMGRHTDGRGKKAAQAYWEARGQVLTIDNYFEGQKGALIEQYKYLATHPLKLIELLANKFYVAWSGDFYSIEYGHNMGSINDLTFYLMLLTSSFIWLLVISIGTVYYKKKEENIGILNYKTILLGVAAVLLITEIMNKYSCYMTLFLYFISFARAELNKTNDLKNECQIEV